MVCPPSHFFGRRQPHAARAGPPAGAAGAGTSGRAPTGTRGAAAGCCPPLLDRECCAMPPVQGSQCQVSPRLTPPSPWVPRWSAKHPSSRATGCCTGSTVGAGRRHGWCRHRGNGGLCSPSCAEARTTRSRSDPTSIISTAPTALCAPCAPPRRVSAGMRGTARVPGYPREVTPPLRPPLQQPPVPHHELSAWPVTAPASASHGSRRRWLSRTASSVITG